MPLDGLVIEAFDHSIVPSIERMIANHIHEVYMALFNPFMVMKAEAAISNN